MSPSARIAMILGGAAAATLVAAVVYARLRRWRRKSPEEIERLRRLDVNRRGRIVSARIVDFIESDAATGAQLLVYKYTLAGVTYESAQDVSALPEALARARHAPDQVASVKYDPKVPTNSIIACEGWCGVPDAGPPPAPEGQAVKTQEKAIEPVSD